MEASRGLLVRLAEGQYGTPTSATDIPSIIEHLRYLLNTRIGEAPTVPDYGIEDLSDLAQMFPEAAETWEKSIRKTIEKYEPRLTDVQVRHQTTDNPMTIAFEIVARLAEGDRNTPITFETQTDPTGVFKIN